MNFDKFSQNRLIFPNDEVWTSECSAFRHVKIFLLHRCDLEWNEVVTILPLFSNLRSLGLCANQIQRLSDVSILVPNLQSLDLEQNQISDWAEISKMASMKK